MLLLFSIKRLKDDSEDDEHQYGALQTNQNDSQPLPYKNCFTFGTLIFSFSNLLQSPPPPIASSHGEVG